MAVVVHFRASVHRVLAPAAAVTVAPAAAEGGAKLVHFDKWGVLLLLLVVGQNFPEVGTELSSRKS